MASKLPVLTFHDVDERRSKISFSPRIFKRGLKRLHESGFCTLSLPEIVHNLSCREAFPDHSLAITFDDGYQSVFNEAFPVLQQYGMSATVFLTVGNKESKGSDARLPSINGRPMLNWQEIKEMQLGGIEFGAHTLTHPNLTRLSSDQVKTEVYESKAIIEEKLGTSVTCFAYPFGRSDYQSRGIVKSHFDCACTDKLGLVAPGSDPFALARVDAFYLRAERLFDTMLSGLFPWYIGACAVPRRIRRAILRGAG